MTKNKNQEETWYIHAGANSASNYPAATPQPDPHPGRQTVGLAVLADILARMETGQQRYGMLLQTHNGRDALMDAYQEALDLCMYLRQAIMERDNASR